MVQSRFASFCFASSAWYRQTMMFLLPRILRLAAPLSVAALCLAPLGARADKIRHPTARFAGLDKITGRIIAFDVAIDETVQFGTLQITPRACYTRPPTEAPLTLGFTEVDEVLSSDEYKRIFSGWMFAASPGLNALEHPVYDVWVTDCAGGKDIIREPVAGLPLEDPANATKPGAQPRPRTQPPQQQQARPANAPAAAPPAGLVATPGLVQPASPARPPASPAPAALPGTAGAQALPPRPATAARPDPNGPLLPPGNIPGPPRRPPSQTYFPATAEPQR